MAAAGVDEVGCFSLAGAMLPLPLSDVIRERLLRLKWDCVVTVGSPVLTGAARAADV